MADGLPVQGHQADYCCTILEEYRERQYYKKPSEIAREEYFRRLAELEKQKRKEQRENKD